MKVTEIDHEISSNKEDDSLRVSLSELRKYSKYSDKTDEELIIKREAYYNMALILLEIEQKKITNKDE